MIYTPKEINKKLVEDFGKKRNFFSLPRLQKVVINYRVPEARDSQESLETAQKEMMSITGQKAKLCRSKKAISSFKLRQNDPLALKVTLRGKRMYHFVEKLFNLVLPQLRDFKGMSPTSFDQKGNYTLTIRDQTYFPEVNLNAVGKIRGVEITLNILSHSIEDSKMLLSTLGFPFQKGS